MSWSGTEIHFILNKLLLPCMDRTLFADHVMQQGSYVQEVKHFLEGLSSCKEHPSETSTDATISMNA